MLFSFRLWHRCRPKWDGFFHVFSARHPQATTRAAKYRTGSVWGSMAGTKLEVYPTLVPASAAIAARLSLETVGIKFLAPTVYLQPSWVSVHTTVLPGPKCCSRRPRSEV